MVTTVTTRTTLRKLTLKSKLGFGKFAELTVQQIIQDLNRADYLVWVYYKCALIEFMPEIHDILKLEHRIAKPGADSPYLEEHKKRLYDAAKRPEPAKEKHIADVIRDKYQTCDRIANTKYHRLNKTNRTESRSSLAWRNQGHR